MKSLFVIATLLALPFFFTNCASSPDPIGDGLDDLDQAIEENLPGLGPNVVTRENETLR